MKYGPLIPWPPYWLVALAIVAVTAVLLHRYDPVRPVRCPPCEEVPPCR